MEINNSNLKFKISICKFYKLLPFIPLFKKDLIIEIPLKDFKGLRLTKKNLLPYQYQYILLHTNEINHFIEDICKNILFTYKYVYKIEFDDLTRITFFSKEFMYFRIYNLIFFIPENENFLSVHRNKYYLKYFENIEPPKINGGFVFKTTSNWENYREKYLLQPYSKEYVGHTGKISKDDPSGKEIQIKLINKEDIANSKYSFVYIKNIQSVRISNPDGTLYYYFILPSDLDKQLKSECNSIFDTNKSINSIELDGHFFDEDILNIENKNNIKFKSLIKRFSTIEVKQDLKVSILWHEKVAGIPQFIKYSAINRDNYNPRYVDNEDEKWFNYPDYDDSYDDRYNIGDYL